MLELKSKDKQNETEKGQRRKKIPPTPGFEP